MWKRWPVDGLLRPDDCAAVGYEEMLKDRENTGEGCARCRTKITDRWYLLAVDRQWHLGCLQCAECNLPLDAELTCFHRHGNIYCKHDYYR